MRACAVLLILPGLATAATPGEQAFERHVRPVLVEHCQGCHGPKKQMGGLRLDSRAAILKGGDSGPAVKPGDVDGSLLVQAVRRTGDLKMPPRTQLPPAAIAALAAWVKAGAPWPEPFAATGTDASKRHWAFQRVQRPPVPAVKSTGWVRNPIDRFVLARLESRGLSPSAEADRRTLLRRLSFDLIGLPPTPEEVDAFLADSRPDAHERLVERLLASPRYGERWARHWLDVARFADTKGYVFFQESEYPWAYTYRDYLIEALNADLGYDRFLVEQIAADLLPGQKDRHSLRALGFLSLGGRFMNNVQDILDDRIDVVTRGLLGLTVSCARCHDHKFDPIPTADYYSLYGVFASTIEPEVPPLFADPPSTPAFAAFAKELAKREQALADFLAAKFVALRTTARTRCAEYLLAAHARRGQPKADDFMLLADPGDLNPSMRVRWQTYLERTARGHHRVFAPWHAFAALAEKDFAGRSKEVMPRLLADQDHPINRHIAQALSASAPATMAEVAKRYAAVLGQVEQKWRREVALARRLKRPVPSRLGDGDEEELRQVFHGPQAPPSITPGLFNDLELLPDRAAQGELQKLRKAVEQWRATGAGAPPRAMVLVDAPRPYEPVVFRRGNPGNPGEHVPRRFLAVLSGAERRPFTEGSGRLELARAIANPENPLTARVLVNRVWLHHFGRGLVQTPGDFGLRSDPPSHPELLDWLAADFVRSGWSIKHLHRLILTSSTYRQASVDRPASRLVDPDNAFLWRMNRKRLDFEAMRDALLALGGQLDGRIGGPSVKDALTPGVRRRTLYAFVDRLHVPGLFRAFDFPSPDASSPRRDTTMVPQQALFLMNNPLVIHCAQSLLTRPEVARQSSAEERVRAMYRLCYGREPDREEHALARAFVAEGSEATWRRYAQALLLGNEFVLVD
jgi:mono/diheme cytochrome c family protein